MYGGVRRVLRRDLGSLGFPSWVLAGRTLQSVCARLQRRRRSQWTRNRHEARDASSAKWRPPMPRSIRGEEATSHPFPHAAGKPPSSTNRRVRTTRVTPATIMCLPMARRMKHARQRGMPKVTRRVLGSPAEQGSPSAGHCSGAPVRCSSPAAKRAPETTKAAIPAASSVSCRGERI